MLEIGMREKPREKIKVVVGSVADPDTFAPDPDSVLKISDSS